VGGGATWADANELVVRLAEQHGIPMITAYGRNDAVPSGHPLYVGPLGRAGSPEAASACRRADVVLAIGSRLGAVRYLSQVSDFRTAQNPGGVGTFNVNAALGNIFSFFVTTTAAVTLAAPTGMFDGQHIILWIANASGGALNIIFNAAYKMSAWTNPANGFNRSIEFINLGGTLYEFYRTPADVPN
jgi:TPP-dependent trihydroxycyclohexane-1,2-dione (THcHDO) dehydratase